VDKIMKLKDGRKGPFFGFSDGGKVILMSRHQNFPVGGVYVVTLKELDRCIIATVQREPSAEDLYVSGDVYFYGLKGDVVEFMPSPDGVTGTWAYCSLSDVTSEKLLKRIQEWKKEKAKEEEKEKAQEVALKEFVRKVQEDPTFLDREIEVLYLQLKGENLGIDQRKYAVGQYRDQVYKAPDIYELYRLVREWRQALPKTKVEQVEKERATCPKCGSDMVEGFKKYWDHHGYEPESDDGRMREYSWTEKRTGIVHRCMACGYNDWEKNKNFIPDNFESKSETTSIYETKVFENDIFRVILERRETVRMYDHFTYIRTETSYSNWLMETEIKSPNFTGSDCVFKLIIPDGKGILKMDAITKARLWFNLAFTRVVL